MKRSFVLLLIVLAGALAAVAPAAADQAPARASSPPLTLIKTCSSRYKHAIIDGEHKCLGSGQFCATRHESIYRRYGFTCKPGSDGRLRLRRR